MPTNANYFKSRKNNGRELARLSASRACDLDKGVHPDDHSPVNQMRGDLSEVTLPPGRTDDMFSRLFYADIPSRLGWAVSRRWYQLRAYWYAWDKEPWVFADRKSTRL